MASLAHQDVAALRTALGVSRERLARMVDVSAKTIERWERGDTQPSGHSAGRLAQLREVAALGQLVYSPAGLTQFLTTPIAAFSYRTAAQMLERGDGACVLAALTADYEGLGA
jgi:transcriptional regulator with XRE-family HTH domain